MRFDFSPVLKPRVLIGAILIGIFALSVTCVVIELFMLKPAPANVIAEMTIIPAPTATPLPPPTPTIDPDAPTVTPTLLPGQIAIGSYVQIKGTEGVGLRIRSAPGLSRRFAVYRFRRRSIRRQGWSPPDGWLYLV